jgi:hypothetical protein
MDRELCQSVWISVNIATKAQVLPDERATLH